MRGDKGKREQFEINNSSYMRRSLELASAEVSDNNSLKKHAPLLNHDIKHMLYICDGLQRQARESKETQPFLRCYFILHKCMIFTKTGLGQI